MASAHRLLVFGSMLVGVQRGGWGEGDRENSLLCTLPGAEQPSCEDR